MPKGPTKRRPRTQAKLLQAARELFAEKGFGATSVGDICGRAGYTSGAFYSNYSSKDELFFALFDAHAAELIERLRDKLTRLREQSATIDELVAAATEIGPEERSWYLISTEFTLYAIRNPAAARTLADHDAKVRALFIPLLDVLRREFDVTVPVDLDHLTRAVIALREGGLAQSLVEPDRLAHGELERTYLPALVLTPLRPPGASIELRHDGR
ncbi:TetR/AcrR family transcriptional regulator [Nocardia sp. NPDC058633]|uniref:TetR/AcrR family transcriptional regulator n=1 Tax=Nocardia sp. NPDC058633 TaxID=3346568 RepID=UPI00365564D2